MIIRYRSKPIPGFEGIYEAHNDGTIWTVKGKTTYRWLHGKKQKRIWKVRQIKPKIEKRQKSKNCDLRVELWKDGKHRTYLVHRLVAMAFIPNPLHLPCINHIDGNPLNNNPHNLEWCTRKYNNIFAIEHEQRNSCKRVNLSNQTMSMNFPSMAEASRWLHRNHGYVSNRLKKGKSYVTNFSNEPFLLEAV